MPWTCPKCGMRLGQQTPNRPLPRVGMVYRCPICKLDMTFDETAKKMKPVWLPPDPKRNDAA